MSPRRAPPMRTYRGKRPVPRPVPPINVQQEDQFDLLLGKPRTQAHVFSSSSEATPDASVPDCSPEASVPRRRFFPVRNEDSGLHRVPKTIKKATTKKFGWKSIELPSAEKSIAIRLRTERPRRGKNLPTPCTSTPKGASTSSLFTADEELDSDDDLNDSLARQCAKLYINTPLSQLAVRKRSAFKKKLSLICPASIDNPEPHSSHMKAAKIEPSRESTSDEEALMEHESSPESPHESFSTSLSVEIPPTSLPVTPEVPCTPRSSLDSPSFTSADPSKNYVTVRRRRVLVEELSPDVGTSKEESITEDPVEIGADPRVNLPLRASLLKPMVLYSHQEQRSLEPLQEDCEEATGELEDERSSLSSNSSPAETPESGSNRTPNIRRKSSRRSEERSPTGRSSIGRASVIPELNAVMEIEESDSESATSDTFEASITLDRVVLLAGKKLRRSLAIIQAFDEEGGLNITADKGRRFSATVEQLLELQKRSCSGANGVGAQWISDEAVRKSLSARRMSWMKQQCTPPMKKRSHRPLDRSAPHDSRRLNLGNFAQNLVIPSSSSEFRTKVLQLCNQDEPCRFTDILPDGAYVGGCKLGEGVFGEVFSLTRNDRSCVMKIMPVEGRILVNGENQKTFAEVYVEMLITQQLSRLGSGFVKVLDMKLVRGAYPEKLLALWHRFDEEKGSENDVPNKFSDSQLFVIIEQENGGSDLEGYTFSTANQAFPVFQQVAYSLAVAEKALEFEHRDLHVGNVLISRTKETGITFVINDTEYVVKTNGVKATIIDYTLSRMTLDGTPFFCDLAKDPGFFIGEGDIQFDVYRYMKKDVGNEWHRFQPKTNVRWLKYLVSKMLRGSYQRTNAKVHAQKILALEAIGDWIQECNSALELAERIKQG